MSNSQTKTHLNRTSELHIEQPRFQVAKDPIALVEKRSIKPNTDSGYHGMTEDEMEVDEQINNALSPNGRLAVGMSIISEASRNRLSREQSTVDRSFHSAIEDFTQEKNESGNGHGEDILTPVATYQSHDAKACPKLLEDENVTNDEKDVQELDKDSLLGEAVGNDVSRSSSEGSSPPKSLLRKSSLTFAALPAREPLATKKSIGPGMSRISNTDGSRATMTRGSFLGRITGGKSIGGLRQPDSAPDGNDETDLGHIDGPMLSREESDGERKLARLHNKASTQRLKDGINMLGKSQPVRSTKSTSTAAPLPSNDMTGSTSNDREPRAPVRQPEDDEDWIKPPSQLPSHELQRPQLSKSITADVMEGVRGKHNVSDEDFAEALSQQKTSPRRQSLPKDSEPKLPEAEALGKRDPMQKQSREAMPPTNRDTALLANENHHQHEWISTTPAGTPGSIRHIDGPLSASKSKLQSIMKTARGLFTSSAGVSAQAKMELCSSAHNSSSDDLSSSKPLKTEVDPRLYPNLRPTKATTTAPRSPARSPAKLTEGRRTRSSTEKEVKRKEREAKEQQRLEEGERARQKENHESKKDPINGNDTMQPKDSSESKDNPPEHEAQQVNSQQKSTRRSPRRVINQSDTAKQTEDSNGPIASAHQVPPLPAQAYPQNPPLLRTKEARRPVKPVKEAPPKPEPQRVAIRVGTLSSLSQRPPINNAALSSSLQESLSTAPQRPPAVVRKASNASVQSSSSHTNMKSTTATKPKALIAAEKKKEQVSPQRLQLSTGGISDY